MKSVILAIVAMASITATAAQYVTVEVCNRGETGDRCEMVTYKVRPASPATPYVETCPVGDVSYGPCPTVYGVPSWLQKLNAYLTSKGFTPVEEDIYAGGN